MKFLSLCFAILSFLTLSLKGSEGKIFFLAPNLQSVDEYSVFHESRPQAEGPENDYLSYNSNKDILSVLNSLKKISRDSYKIFVESSSISAAKQVACAGIGGARFSARACTSNLEISLEETLKLVKKSGVRKTREQQAGGLVYAIGQILKPKKKKKGLNN